MPMSNVPRVPWNDSEPQNLLDFLPALAARTCDCGCKVAPIEEGPCKGGFFLVEPCEEHKVRVSRA